VHEVGGLIPTSHLTQLLESAVLPCRPLHGTRSGSFLMAA